MRRRLFNAAALVSLVLYVLVLAAFARSLWAADLFEWVYLDEYERVHYVWYATVQSGRGGIQVACDAEINEHEPAERRRSGWMWRGWTSGPRRYPRPAFTTLERARFGFWFKWTSNPATVRREVIVPYWFLAVLTGVLPSLWLVRRRRESVRRRRAAAGLCIGCGYDLRASTDR